jgi:hypothetical protein
MRPSGRILAGLLLLAFLPACTSYRTVADPAVALQASPKPIKKARVTIDTGKRFELRSPHISGDSIQGSLRDGSEVSVPMSTVQEVEVRQPSDTKTYFLVIGIILALGGAAVGIAAIILGGG